jgi:hypothetical protein
MNRRVSFTRLSLNSNSKLQCFRVSLRAYRDGRRQGREGARLVSAAISSHQRVRATGIASAAPLNDATVAARCAAPAADSSKKWK